MTKDSQNFQSGIHRCFSKLSYQATNVMIRTQGMRVVRHIETLRIYELKQIHRKHILGTTGCYYITATISIDRFKTYLLMPDSHGFFQLCKFQNL